MSSLSRNGLARSEPTGAILRVLDLGFGFFVWSAHLLTVYVAAAVVCVLRVGAAGSTSGAVFQGILVLVTLLAAAAVIWHAIRRYRRTRGASDPSFRAWVAIGSDAVALVAIVWQLFPILLLPLCA